MFISSSFDTLKLIYDFSRTFSGRGKVVKIKSSPRIVFKTKFSREIKKTHTQKKQPTVEISAERLKLFSLDFLFAEATFQLHLFFHSSLGKATALNT